MVLKITKTGKSKSKVSFSKDNYIFYLGRDIAGGLSENKVIEFIEKVMRYVDSFINTPLKGVVHGYGHHDYILELYANKSDPIISITMKHFDIEGGVKYLDYIKGRI